jgi:hypothetical protein
VFHQGCLNHIGVECVSTLDSASCVMTCCRNP